MRPRFRFRLRTLIVTVVGLSLAMAYIGTYHRLSRRGMHEAEAYGLDGFLYVPFEQAAADQNLARHHALAAFYAPANWADRQFFRGEAPVECILWRLSG